LWYTGVVLKFGDEKSMDATGVAGVTVEPVEVELAITSTIAVKVTAEDELKSMGAVAAALEPIAADTGTLARVLRWVNERYGQKSASLPVLAPNAIGAAGQLSSAPVQQAFDTLADHFAAANPNTEAEKTLVVAFWIQVREGQAEWTGISVNKELKHLGHGVKNITMALEALIQQKPQLAIQTRKTGKSRQARKLYKLTAEGLKRVREMLHSQGTSEEQQ